MPISVKQLHEITHRPRDGQNIVAQEGGEEPRCTSLKRQVVSEMTCNLHNYFMATINY